jgi:hypothetical protein
MDVKVGPEVSIEHEGRAPGAIGIRGFRRRVID